MRRSLFAMLLGIGGLVGSGCVGKVIDESNQGGFGTGMGTGTGTGTGGQTGEDPPPSEEEPPPATANCSQAGACPCSSNYDCPDGYLCHADNEARIYCAPGARGAGLLGSPCSGIGDCASGLCHVSPDGTSVCTDRCTVGECAGSQLATCTQLNVTPPLRACL